jgi:MFS family permease
MALADAPAGRQPGLGATFWWLWAGSLLSWLASFVAPFLTVYLTGRGLPPARAGLVAACFHAGALVGLLAGGRLADRLGRRRTLLAGLLLAGATAAGLARAEEPAAIAAVVLLFGVGTAAGRPPIRATVADLVRPDQLRRAFGLLYWAENLGGTTSFLAAGILSAHGWGLPFLLDAATTLAFAGVVLLRIPETRPAGSGEGAAGAGYRVVLRDRACLVLLALFALFNLAYAQAMVTLPLQMATLRFSTPVIGAVMAVSAVTVALVQPWTPRLLRRLPTSSILALGAVLAGIGLGAQAFCRSPLHFAATSVVWSLGEIVFFGFASAAVMALAPPEARGRYSAASGLVFTGTSALAGAGGAAVLQELGAAVLWSGCLVVCLAAAAGLLGWRRMERSALADGAALS